jgi:large subunit ribosomal protein L23
MSRARSWKPTEKTSLDRIYSVIKAPVVTEKSTRNSEFNQVTFKVALDATKIEIKAAVETLFKVKVVAVNTVRQLERPSAFVGS